MEKDLTNFLLVSSCLCLFVLSARFFNTFRKGYRLFENYDPRSVDDCSKFGNELERRLFNIDTSELQRVDRCTMYHGLEARVPFLDKNFILTVSKIDHIEVRHHYEIRLLDNFG